MAILLAVCCLLHCCLLQLAGIMLPWAMVAKLRLGLSSIGWSSVSEASALPERLLFAFHMITVEAEPAHGLQADLMQHLLRKDQLHQRELRQVCLDGIPCGASHFCAVACKPSSVANQSGSVSLDLYDVKCTAMHRMPNHAPSVPTCHYPRYQFLCATVVQVQAAGLCAIV